MKSNTFNSIRSKIEAVKSVILNEMQCSEESQIMGYQRDSSFVRMTKAKWLTFETAFGFLHSKKASSLYGLHVQ
ncbi:MAG TPA: hypothetical protein DIT10_10940 [Chryseobacterium sp.]|nr:hypothetical protein [Chryseobacterium sp.]